MKRLCIILILCGACAAMTLPEFVEKYLTSDNGSDGIWNLRDYAQVVCPRYGPVWTKTTTARIHESYRPLWSPYALQESERTVITIEQHYLDREVPNRQWYVEPKPVKPVTLIDPNSIDDPMLRAVVKKLLEAK